jgi:hypothetical protein
LYDVFLQAANRMITKPKSKNCFFIYVFNAITDFLTENYIRVYFIDAKVIKKCLKMKA